MIKTRWIAVALLAASTVALAGDRHGRGGSHGHPGGRAAGGRYWVPAEYSFEEREVVIPAEYRTVERREWVEPVYETRVRRVWVENRRCDRPFGFRIGRVKIGLGRSGRGGYYKTVRERVCVQEGYHRTVQERVCIAPERIEIVREKVLVHDGYWAGGQRGYGGHKGLGGRRGPRCGTGINVRGARYP